ncbi:hypothetical protein [Romboutsia sp.]|uniref:hypothetical protein n=1 Tax=Romboutsia sp. TaxID=1965302 RepID=UPI002B93AE6B|nr:hypothetical protein [Romboutsia sp.]HSQ88145.1 hypothetical protein [Romboutsia sp.]
MSSKLTRVFDCFGGGGWWIIVLFFLFMAFQESWSEICITDWIPFLILLLILCACGGLAEEGLGCLDNDFECGC